MSPSARSGPVAPEGICRVLVAAPPFDPGDPSGWGRLQAAGLELADLRDRASLRDADFLRALAGADALILGNRPRVDGALLGRAPRLRCLAKLGAGLDNVDVAAASRRGVLVFHTPGANTEAVADYAFGLLLALARHLVRADAEVRAGGWTKHTGVQIWGKTLGVVGMGAVGRAVTLRARGFRMEVLGCGPSWPEEFARTHGVARVGFDEILSRADVLTLHCPLTEATRGLIGGRELARMKPGAFLINTARGELVDEGALARALSAGTIAGAALDVFAQEPPSGSPLLGLPNVLLSSHMAWCTDEARQKMNAAVAEQLLQVLRGEPPDHLVNRDALARGAGRPSSGDEARRGMREETKRS